MLLVDLQIRGAILLGPPCMINLPKMLKHPWSLISNDAPVNVESLDKSSLWLVKSKMPQGFFDPENWDFRFCIQLRDWFWYQINLPFSILVVKIWKKATKNRPCFRKLLKLFKLILVLQTKPNQFAKLELPKGFLLCNGGCNYSSDEKTNAK